MKLRFQHITWIVTVVVMSTALSCKKFINEELVTVLSDDYYKTDAGLEDLVKSAYLPLQWKFSEEQSYAMHNFGVDEFREGDQFNNVRYNDYDANLNSNDAFVNGLWSNNYAGIRRCNQGIEAITNYNNPSSATLGTDAKKRARIAELKALRGLFYFQMVQQFGGIPLVLSTPVEPQYEFPRATVAAVYEQIIRDFRSAGPDLPWRQLTDRGRASRAMAYHFLAKAYLTRGSAIADVRGQKPTDMDSAVFFADDVIRNSGHALEADYGSLFDAGYADGRVPALGENGTAPTGTKAKIDANNASNEIIFAAQFTSNLNLAGAAGTPGALANNQTHLYYPTQYDNGMPGMTRDFFNGRPFRRLRPTDYTIDIFDKINDSRFFKTFQTVYLRNVTSDANLPVFTAANAPNPSLVNKPRVGIGDTAAFFIVNPPDRPILTSTLAAMRYYAVYARNKQATAAGPITTDFSANKYLSMIKFSDPIRLTTTVNEARGIRNGTLARLAETYLIIAEAYGRKTDYANAITYVNVLRRRAAYKQNEIRPSQIWRFLGGPSTLDNTETANLATDALFTAGAPGELYPPVSSVPARFVHFMLNERTRELCGEFYRWEDLVRTETFFERTKLFNPDISGSFAQFHKLRPIPYLQMLVQTVNGQPMSPTDMAAYQNPGY